MRTVFIKGIDLNRRFFQEAIKPLLDTHYPDLKYSAALLGYGSDVLGCDTATSMDHNWGPRCLVFLNQDDFPLAEELKNFFSYNLPFSFLGFSTHYSHPRNDHTQKMIHTVTYPVTHLIEIFQLEEYFQNQLHVKDVLNVSRYDWLNFQDQVLLELTSGDVFHDGLNRLAAIRNTLNFYPSDILKLRLASLWQSVSNEEAFIGRCIELNDIIGLKLIAARIVNALMKIAFYCEQRYIPYSKWLGTAFKQLAHYRELQPLIQSILDENNPAEIEAQVCALALKLVDIHNRNAELPLLDNTIQRFYGRPSKVIFAERIVAALVNSIEDQELKKRNLNKIALDLKLDSVDLTE